MSDDVRKLSEVVPPPEGRRPDVDWPAVFAALGTELPRDYRQLISVYGGGQFDDHLYLLEPSSSRSGYDIARLQEERSQALDEIWKDGEPKPRQLEDGARLIVWATTDDGQCVYWLVRPGQSADDWTLLLQEGRGPQWEHFAMGCASFLAATLTGTVRSKLLSSDYPTDPHTFVPMSAL
ncbi:SMI1/KNR4 family protein [Dactylosporangium sp. NPDC051541]|uniref:SMI1/KNR4 family protein n=1 Tax=Dactylosporangium sp. NPDC051541 TaxID=3363977 RepID=UPI0037B03708